MTLQHYKKGSSNIVKILSIQENCISILDDLNNQIELLEKRKLGINNQIRYYFQNKYEDFLLSGEYNEPTFIRNTVATQLDRDNVPNTLVDVLFRHKNGNYTYEGIYILTPHPLDKETLKHELQINNASTTPCNNHAIPGEGT